MRRVKTISIIESIQLSAFDGPANYEPGTTDRLVERAEENRSRVIRGAAIVESNLQAIIATYFFQDRPDDEVRRMFRDHILSSSWCTFEAKRQLVMVIAAAIGHRDDAWRSKLGERLRDAIRYRNCFTHGDLSTNGREVKLAWFMGGPDEAILTDKWLTKIEVRLKEAFNLTQELGVALAPKGPPEVKVSKVPVGASIRLGNRWLRAWAGVRPKVRNRMPLQTVQLAWKTRVLRVRQWKDDQEFKQCNAGKLKCGVVFRSRRSPNQFAHRWVYKVEKRFKAGTFIEMDANMIPSMFVQARS